eukprot:1061069-Lingulodinium_polyedra.AAC.1
MASVGWIARHRKYGSHNTCVCIRLSPRRANNRDTRPASRRCSGAPLRPGHLRGRGWPASSGSIRALRPLAPRGAHAVRARDFRALSFLGRGGL